MMDNVQIFGTDQEKHDKNLAEALMRIERAGLTLNKEKHEFSKAHISFLAQTIDSTGVLPDLNKVSAIKKVPTPHSITEVRRFLGMTNQLSKFIPNLNDKTKPLRELLDKNRQWTWDYPQQEAFNTVKELLSTIPALALYDLNVRSIESADASSYGLGGPTSRTNQLRYQTCCIYFPIIVTSRVKICTN